MTTRNAAVAEWQAYLTNRNRRHRDGRFLIQGREAIAAALRHGWPVQTLVYRLGAPALPGWARELLDAGTVPAVGLVPELMVELAENYGATPELVAVAAMRAVTADEVRPPVGSGPPVIVVVERPESPLRLGGTIHTAHAFGAAAVGVSGPGADEYDPQCVRASAGSLFALPVFRVPGPAAVREFRDRRTGRGADIRIIGVVAADDPDVGTARPVDTLDFTGGTIVVVGEGDLGAAWRAECDVLVRVPAAGTLAAPCTASVVLYEISRQRRALRRG
ncbi:TrmH family RNA methyltransferase [Nocardia sp. alder85J]|uniref:TrmH family RNA methyltransferase n=1 Tax=Nocardia sp. alder85J TaxID=2862949 RepID=UPI001CD4CADC|nr:TrmH family RNA methyltransferase [Nocardia sp. alder85J]MCX4094974.1 rRNA methyltransferase [Nocardia sp. alder85J]